MYSEIRTQAIVQRDNDGGTAARARGVRARHIPEGQADGTALHQPAPMDIDEDGQ